MSPLSKKIDQQFLVGEDYVEIWVEAFLKERKAQNLAKGTIRNYREKLKSFLDYLSSQEIKYISQITSNDIRDFLLLLEERDHNARGVHGFFRPIKTFLRWYWEEVEPAEKNHILRVRAPRVPVEAIEGISKEDFELLLSVCPRNTFYGERDKAILLTLLESDFYGLYHHKSMIEIYNRQPYPESLFRSNG